MHHTRLTAAPRAGALLAASLALSLLALAGACREAPQPGDAAVDAATGSLAVEAVPTDAPTATSGEGAASTDGAAEPTSTAGASDVVELTYRGDRMELVMCGDMPCPQRGAEDAPVTVVELYDYFCEHCDRHLVENQPILDAEYVDTGKVRVVSHVLAFRAADFMVAGAALCAHEQGKYYAFRQHAVETRVIEESTDMPGRIIDAGSAIDGLDPDAFRACVEENRYEEVLRQSTDQAQQMSVFYTPAFVVNGLMIEGSDFDVLRRKIDQALEAAGG